ncbi:hypothetical protein KVR01_012199 [Diaporthe batatas]|uniref:uncharacterized protein n=1 Tax=Diaporthe batatas TaxID=748121 RepID=UPI001D0567E6|nr:uncharacterized protein KVR01_012199 [Diaporthe batatas]KAG8157927.1 hypothetical protein KVR01_012199 [Diaporthe batatas]
MSTEADIAAYVAELNASAAYTRSRWNEGESRFWFWSPPKDLDKPRLPYIPGFAVQIRRHLPPPPFGGRDYGMGTREVLSQSYLLGATQSEMVIDHPSADTPPPAQSETAHLTVVAPIAIGGVRGAQLVACEISPWSHGDKPLYAVAKIFDPMYYNCDYYNSREPHDTVWQADSDYSREAAAYEHLQKNLTDSAPKYFGSWTFDLPITSRGVPRSRPVRMILIERLDGVTMRSMRVRNDPEEPDDAFHYPEEYRLEVLAIAMDQYARMEHSGLDHIDFADRNVMLVTSTKPSAQVPIISGLPLPRVVLVDYHASVVHDLAAKDRRPQRRTALPINPMQRWRDMPMNEFIGWVPAEWHSTPRLKSQWLEKRFGGPEQRKLYTMDEATTKATTTSRPQSRGSGTDNGQQVPNDPPILPRCIPWNPVSEEMKALKAELKAKREKETPGAQKALPVRNGNHK